jgi:tRNA (Thr-GGU) A37 N-methylase
MVCNFWRAQCDPRTRFRPRKGTSRKPAGVVGERSISRGNSLGLILALLECLGRARSGLQIDQTEATIVTGSSAQ